MLLLFRLFCSHDSSSSQFELIFVSPILNTHTYKTPFSHSCLSSYSHLHFNCEHHEGSDGLVTWSFSLHCGPFKPSSKVFSLVFFARCRNERKSSSQSIIPQHSYISLSKSCPSFGLCYSVLNGSPPYFLSDSLLSPSKDLLHFSPRLVETF